MLAGVLAGRDALDVPGAREAVHRAGRNLGTCGLVAQAHGVALMVDANGGYCSGQARRVGAALDELGVVWCEEPVTSDDVAGLALLRGALRCDVAAGEYVWDGSTPPGCCPAWTACSWTPPGAAATPAGCAAPRWPPRPGCRCPGTARRRCTRRSPRPCPGCATSSGSPTTPGSSRSWWTAPRRWWTARCVVGDSPGHGMTLAAGAERWRTG